jgi:hypothetical protein
VTENFVGWRKSSYSGPNNNCVEVGRACDRVGIRDTKNREAGHLAVPVPRFLDFIGSVKDEAFER